MVKTIKLLLLLIFPVLVSAQEISKLTLQQAYDLARNNYPVIRQKDLIRQTENINIENLSKGFLPQVTLSGQATYQSDVTTVPVSIPGISIESASKDQYRILADVSQLIYDGGITKEQKALQQLNANVEDQKVEVELYKLKERINQLFLGILFLDEQLKQTELVKADIRTGIKKVEAQVQNGVSFRSNLSMLKAELLKTDQRAVDVAATRKGYLDALSVFIGQTISGDVLLEKPVSASPAIVTEISRPEIKLYSDLSNQIAGQSKLITAKNLPKASLFVQGGYGRPGLNQLENKFSLYYTGGVRLNWSLGGLYTKKKEKELVEVNRKINDIQKETFILNTNSQLKQQKAEVEKLEKLVVSDAEIIQLRSEVTNAAKAQLENGVITANDYLKEVNAEDQARQSLITHEVQLLQAKINYQTISGKQ